MSPSLRYLTVEGVYPSRKDKNLSIQIGVGGLGGRGHRFGWSSIRGGTKIAVGSLVISITFETSVLKGTTQNRLHLYRIYSKIPSEYENVALNETGLAQRTDLWSFVCPDKTPT